MVASVIQMVVVALVVWHGLNEVIPMKYCGSPLFAFLTGFSLTHVPVDDIGLGYGEIPGMLFAESFPGLLKVLWCLGHDDPCEPSFMPRQHFHQLSQFFDAPGLDWQLPKCGCSPLPTRPPTDNFTPITNKLCMLEGPRLLQRRRKWLTRLRIPHASCSTPFTRGNNPTAVQTEASFSYSRS